MACSPVTWSCCLPVRQWGENLSRCPCISVPPCAADGRRRSGYSGIEMTGEEQLVPACSTHRCRTCGTEIVIFRSGLHG